MTMQTDMPRNFPATPLSRERSANTLRLRALMEQQQRLEIGKRIRDLREASPQTNASIADHVGVGERAVANWISGTTGITYKNAKKVAELFDVDVRWLWDGVQREPGDLMDSLSSAQGAKGTAQLEDALDALKAETGEKLDALHTELEEIRTQLESLARRPSTSGS